MKQLFLSFEPNLRARSIAFIAFMFFSSYNMFAQTQSACVIDFPDKFDDQVNFSAIYNPALCVTGDVVMNNLNDWNGVSTLTFDQSITLNSLALNFKNGNNPIEIIIPVGVTLTITNDLIMDVNSTPQDKVLNVDGVLDVGGTLDFGDIDLEIDGTGTIDAGEIIGGANTTCDLDGDCPIIVAPICTEPSGLCTEPGTVTPVELIYFSGAENQNAVLLNWATASEENFDYFEIERATEGTSFDFIGEVKGDGNSFKRLDYSFTDYSPEIGLNYYRLKSIDLDGTFEYSDVILVRFTSNVKLLVSPNPTLGIVSIKTSLPTTGSLNYEITNQYGVVVLKGNLDAYNTQIDLQGLTKGIYIIRLIDLPAVKAKRIILK